MNFWKKIIKNYTFLIIYKKIKMYNKIKRLKKFKWLMLRKNINMIFTRRRYQNRFIKKKKNKYSVLKNKQYSNILFKLNKKNKKIFTKTNKEKRNKKYIIYNRFKKI
jgi:hypothetical protein